VFILLPVFIAFCAYLFASFVLMVSLHLSSPKVLSDSPKVLSDKYRS
jgi:hypothetical protein